MRRTIIVGDVHGCLRELRELMERIGLTDEDQLCFVGDLIARGPDTLGVLDWVRDRGAVAVRGNHEHKLLVHEQAKGDRTFRLGPTHAEIAKALGKTHWKLLRAMPLWHELPEHGVRIVHAGVVPSAPIDQVDPAVLTTIRAMTATGEPSAERRGEPWAQRYVGPPHIVFGHNALMHPQLHVWATGIDTGCVYGGFLTAMVLAPGQAVPPVGERMDVLVSAPARRAYFPVRPVRPTG